MEKVTVKLAFMAAVIASLFVGCSMFGGGDDDSGGGDTTPRATGISFVKNNITIDGAEDMYLQFNVTPRDVQNRVHIDWTYDEKMVALDPDNYGVVIHPKAAGTTYIRATVDGHTAACLITMTGNPDIYEGKPYIYSNFTTVEMQPGEKTTVTAMLFSGASTDYENMQWSISDPSVASIDSARGSCIVTARKNGSARITVHHEKSAFDYNMIVYVSDGTFTNPFITTTQNVVIIDKNETSLRNVVFEVKNAVEQNYGPGFSYEIIPEAGQQPVVSVIGTGNTAALTPLRGGLSILRAHHKDCKWDLDVIVKVVTIVKNTYIEVSPSTLRVKGSDDRYSVSAKVTGYEGIVDAEQFTWTVDENDKGPRVADCMDFESSGDTLYITGKKNGVFRARVSHELCSIRRSVLIVLTEQAGSAIDSSMYITTGQNYVVTKIGAQPTTVGVSLIGGLPGDERNLEWKLDNGADNSFVSVTTPTGNIIARALAAGSAAESGKIVDGKIIIEPKAVGSTTISVSHPKILYSTDIAVRVASEYALLEEPAYIVTDTSLIKMLNGTQKTFRASLSGNFTTGDEYGMTWRSENASIISVTGAGAECNIRASGSGSHQTYIYIRHPKALSEKKILVLSADTQDELDAMKGFYADNTYLRVEEGGNGNLGMESFGLTDSEIAGIQWTSSNSTNAIVGANAGNHLKATVNGIKRGNITVKASLTGCADCVFDVTVCPVGEADVISSGYLTTQMNTIVLAKAYDSVDVKVTGVHISSSDMMRTEWNIVPIPGEASGIISINGNGDTYTVTAQKPGKTRIKVTNPASNNELYIEVKVGAIYEWADDFFTLITTEEDTYTMMKGTKRDIAAALENSTQVGQFTWKVTTGNDLIEITPHDTGSRMCLIEAKEAGMAQIEIRNTLADFEKEILVVISNSYEELAALQYLTTAQNVVTVGETFNQTVTVSVANALKPVIDGYTWTVENSSIAEVVGSGSMAVVYGKKQGTTKVTVTNKVCPYSLDIIINVVDPVMVAKNPYITCDNIRTIKVGDPSETLKADLVGGTASDAQFFTWQISDSSIVQLLSSNDTAQIRALKTGVAQVSISHPKAAGINRTVLVICEPKVETNCTITLSEAIVKMKPSDGAKNIIASLDGASATAADASGFNWWADNYDIIDLSASGTTAVVTPKGSGTVTLHCSHPKSAFEKTCVFYIADYTELAFANDSMQLTTGVQTFANIQVPAVNTSSKISYSVTDAISGAASSGIAVSGTKSVCVLDPKKAGTYTVTAKLISTATNKVLGSCQMLCTVKAADVDPDFINYTGNTIITLQKGESQMLRANMAGPNMKTNDEASIKWKCSRPDVVRITPSSSTEWSIGKEVQIEAIKAGEECTVTIHFDKYEATGVKVADVNVYIIVAGESIKTVMLDRPKMNLLSDGGAEIVTATLSGGNDDGADEHLVWTLTQSDPNDPVVKIAGDQIEKNRKVTILPVRAGKATLTCLVPSSQKIATCDITVEAQRTLTLDRTMVEIYPTKQIDIHYSVSPASDLGNVKWTWDDNGYASFIDDKNGTLTIIGKALEGVSQLTGEAPLGAQASILVKNGWNNKFTLSKTTVSGPPIVGDSAEEKSRYKIDYTMSPDCCEIYVSNVDNNIILDPACYDDVQVHGKTSTYIIKPGNGHYKVDNDTHTASGTITFVPKGETNSQCEIQPYNPTIIGQDPAGFIDGAQKVVNLKVYYGSYTYGMTVTGRTDNAGDPASFTHYTPSAKTLYIGDGETAKFTVASEQAMSTPKEVKVFFMPAVDENKIEEDTAANKCYYKTSANSARTNYQWYNCGQKNKSGVELSGVLVSGELTYSLNLLDDLTSAPAPGVMELSTVSDVVKAGHIVVKYTPVFATSASEFKFPVYVEVRPKCAATDTAYGTTNMNQ